MAAGAGTGVGTMAAGHGTGAGTMAVWAVLEQGPWLLGTEPEHGTMAVWDGTGARYHGCVGRHWSTEPWLLEPQLGSEPWLLGPELGPEPWLLGPEPWLLGPELGWNHGCWAPAGILALPGGRLAPRAAVGERWRGVRAPRPPGDDLVLVAVLEAVGRASAGLRRTTAELTDGNQDNGSSSNNNPVTDSPTPIEPTSSDTMEISSSPPLTEMERENMASWNSQEVLHGGQQPITDEQDEEEAAEKENGKINEDEECDYLVFEIGEQKGWHKGEGDEGGQDTETKGQEEEYGGRGDAEGKEEGTGETERKDEGRGDTEREDGGRGDKEREDGGRGDTEREDGGRGDTEREDGGRGDTEREDGGRGDKEREDGGRGDTEREDGGRGDTEREDGGRGDKEREDGGRERQRGKMEEEETQRGKMEEEET
ncbi:hypothetical protein F7725_012119 [Dissostichus mawsoni]|uniref:Uncharacterized protein n=1 Tax=Dissostichus mawsoni TaxID=36200 RepID=A0A7J5ZEX5_DISMA|nr:hypothetical protein F7725_012119 [Dissostichus mawsoni]